MTHPVSPIVQNRDGLLGVLEHPELVRDDSDARIAVRLTSGQVVLVPPDLMVMQPDGSFHLDLSAAELLAMETETEEGVAGSAHLSPHQVEDGSRGKDAVVVPVVAEMVEVDKRQVESGRVRVEKTVETTDQVINESLIHEDVEIERIPINKIIEAPVGNRQEGDTLVVSVLKEVLVVEKRLMLVEEVRITRRRVEQPFSQTVPVRTETVVVERADPEEGPKSRPSMKKSR